MRYFLITNEEALIAQVGRYANIVVMVDIERMGKRERQPGGQSFLSDHELSDVRRLSVRLPPDRLMLRINPLHDGSGEEIDAGINSGAGWIMLPMYTSRADVARFLDLLRGRARPVLLAETPASVLRFETYSDLLPPNTLIHLGLNDLHLAMGLTHMFEVVSGGFAEFALNKFAAAHVEYGFGGVGLSQTDLVPSDLVLRAHVAFGSSAVILSRSFQAAARTSFQEAFGRIEHQLREAQQGPRQDRAAVALDIRARLCSRR